MASALTRFGTSMPWKRRGALRCIPVALTTCTSSGLSALTRSLGFSWFLHGFSFSGQAARYNGQWHEDKKHGYGVLFFRNGGVYAARFLERRSSECRLGSG